MSTFGYYSIVVILPIISKRQLDKTCTRSFPVSATTRRPRPSRVCYNDKKCETTQHSKYTCMWTAIIIVVNLKHLPFLPKLWVKKVDQAFCLLGKCCQWRQTQKRPQKWSIAWNFSIFQHFCLTGLTQLSSCNCFLPPLIKDEGFPFLWTEGNRAGEEEARVGEGGDQVVLLAEHRHLPGDIAP